MAANILRPAAAWARVGVRATKFKSDFVLKDESDPFVPGTDVRRVRPIPLGERAIGFFDDELDVLVEDLRLWRNNSPLKPRPVLERLREGRDAWRERVNKERARSAATNRQGERDVVPANDDGPR